MKKIFSVKQSNTIPNVDEALDIINSVITKVNDLTACMQKSSISTNQYLEYETAVSNFKQELSHLKNFLILSPKQQLASFKLIFNVYILINCSYQLTILKLILGFSF